MSSPELDRTDELIVYFVERLSGQITRTRLIKFIYLADYEARRWLGAPISTLTYSYDRFGPYDKTLHDHLGHVSHLVEEEPRRWIDHQGYVYHSRSSSPVHRFTREERILLDHIAERYSSLPLPELLDEVVYQTEPMRKAIASDARFTVLDMDSVNNEARRKFGSDLKQLLEAKDELDTGRWRELK
ncbi:MAG TPA: Panacea domain-containing protein [Planctomycetota bacterium]|nr:Panacea domain-containing protein [Planctomycetota bacterium]